MKQQARVTMADRIMAGMPIGVMEGMSTNTDNKTKRKAAVAAIEEGRALEKSFRNGLTIFNIKNVNDYAKDISTESFVSKLTCLRSPFPRVWFECALTTDSPTSDNTDKTAVGILLEESQPFEDGSIIQTFTIYDEYGKNSGHAHGHSKGAFFRKGITQIRIAVEGNPLDGGTVIDSFSKGEADEHKETLELGKAMLIALMSIQFTNCNNVTTPEYDQPLNFTKHYEKKNGIPLLKHRTININPIGGGTGKSHTGSVGAKSFHICRGHFATYSPERPLFGKLSGTFWMPSHVRGNRDVGEVKSDYNVFAPVLV